MQTTTTPYRALSMLKGRGKLTIAKTLLDQIDALHEAHPGNEWSGVLVFKPINDDVSNPEKTEFEAIAIFPMDFGSPGYTEYDLNERLIDIYETFPAADPSNGPPTLKFGQIHTHHSMSAFFSGTDDSELRDNADKYDYYLSLIVNLSGRWCAKVAFEATIPVKIKKAGTEEEEIQERDILAAFDLDIVKERNSVTEDWFNKQIDELKKKPVRHYQTSEFDSSYSRPYGTYGYNNYPTSNNRVPNYDYRSYGNQNHKESKKEEEKEKEGKLLPMFNQPSSTTNASVKVTRDLVRRAMPFLFLDDKRQAQTASAYLLIANHKLNDAPQMVLNDYAKKFVKKLDAWMYEHLFDAVFPGNSSRKEFEIIEIMIDIFDVCRNDSRVANALCVALKEHVKENYFQFVVTEWD